MVSPMAMVVMFGCVCSGGGGRGGVLYLKNSIKDLARLIKPNKSYLGVGARKLNKASTKIYRYRLILSI